MSHTQPEDSSSDTDEKATEAKAKRGLFEYFLWALVASAVILMMLAPVTRYFQHRARIHYLEHSYGIKITSEHIDQYTRNPDIGYIQLPRPGNDVAVNCTARVQAEDIATSDLLVITPGSVGGDSRCVTNFHDLTH